MTFASVRAAAQEAAKRGSLTPHQLAALTALDQSLTDAQRQQFTDLWRAQGSPAAPATPNIWGGVLAAAAQAGARHPNLVAAQWALESNWGKHFSGTWNAFGLKGNGSAKKTTEYVNGKPITITAEFIDFPDLRSSIQYLVDRWYKDWNGHKGVNNAPNQEAAARELVKQGYATDPAYADKLIRLMKVNADHEAVIPLANQRVTVTTGVPVPTGMVGPRKAPTLKPGDHHLIANDRTETLTAFTHDGKRLWAIPCLCRGQGAETDWKTTGSDTPPGLYKVGKVYRDYEQDPSPRFTAERRSFGWYSFDLEGQEGQEGSTSRPYRDGIMIHGGGTACGWPGAWAPRQTLHTTFGCIRCHNVDLRERILPLLGLGTVWVSVLQEAP